MDMKYKIKPWAHQLDVIKRATSQRDFALFLDMGTGKTASTINILRHRFLEKKRILKTLVLCPVVVCENWRREFYAHSQIGHLAIVLKGSQKQRLKTFRELKDKRPFHIFITNYEALQMKELLQELLIWQPEVLICDESQRLKNPEAVRTKMAIMLAQRTQHNYILSGSPILNSPMDIFSQFHVLDRGETFGDKFYVFRHRFFRDLNQGMPSQRYFPNYKIRDELIEPLNQAIYSKAFRVMKSECLDLPPFLRMELEVELAPEQERVYREMKNNFIAFLDSDTCTASMAIVKALRLQQIVSGFIKTDAGEEIRIKDNPRLNALEDFLTDVPETEKIIIWAAFHENYAQIAEVLNRLKLPFVELHGQISAKDRQPNIDRFQNDPSCRVIVANAAAGGVGVNLTAASISLFYSRTFSLEHDLQAEARNYRGGSEIHKKVTRVDLVARGTIDQVCLEALKNKLDLAERVLELRRKLS